MAIDKIPSAGIESGGVAPSNLSTGAPTWNTSGDVGIGTSSPGAKLNVAAGDSASATNQVNISGGRSLGGGVFGSAGSILFTNSFWSSGYGAASISGMDSGSSGGFLGFATTSNGGGTTGVPTERARIDSSGLFRIGNSSGGNGVKLQVHGDTSPDSLCSFRDTRTDSYSGAPIMYFQRTSGTVGSITTTTTTTAYNTSSDYRLKENIAPMTGALSRVAALKPCVYTWKATGETDEGFIAHELAEVCPSAVTGEKDAVNEDGSIKPQGIDTSFLVATLTAAIQELKAEVDALRAQVEAK